MESNLYISVTPSNSNDLPWQVYVEGSGYQGADTHAGAEALADKAREELGLEPDRLYERYEHGEGKPAHVEDERWELVGQQIEAAYEAAYDEMAEEDGRVADLHENRHVGSLSFQGETFEDPDLTVTAEEFAQLRRQMGDDGKLLQNMTEVALGGQEGAHTHGEVVIENVNGELSATWDDGDIRRTDAKEFAAYVEREHPEVYAAANREALDDLIMGPRDADQPERSQGIDLVAATEKFSARQAERQTVEQTETLSR